MVLLRWLMLALLLPLTACERAVEAPLTLDYRSTPAAESIPLYRFAVHPLHNPIV